MPALEGWAIRAALGGAGWEILRNSWFIDAWVGY